MSSIRLFILAAFAEHGEMHGHQIRLLAEQEYVSMWTDISVGSVYGAINRLVAEGLLVEVRTERPGNRPTRLVYTITKAGRIALAQLREQGLRNIWFRPDPFDLALTRATPDLLDGLPEMLQSRLADLRALYHQTQVANAGAVPHITSSERWALSHAEHRLRAEIGWLEQLLAATPKIIADERTKPHPRHP